MSTLDATIMKNSNAASTNESTTVFTWGCSFIKRTYQLGSGHKADIHEQKPNGAGCAYCNTYGDWFFMSDSLIGRLLVYSYDIFVACQHATLSPNVKSRINMASMKTKLQ